MAKKAKDTGGNGAGASAPVAPVTSEYTDLADLFARGVVRYGDYQLPLSEMVGVVKGVLYLCQNGFSQSMTDAAAFTKDQKAGKSDDEIAAMAKDARDKRFNDIRTGSVGTRVGGPKLPQIDRVMREVAEERLRAIASARNVAMPKGDVLKAALEKIIQRDPDGIRAEAETRIANAKAVATQMGDDDLFAAPAAPAAQS